MERIATDTTLTLILFFPLMELPGPSSYFFSYHHSLIAITLSAISPLDDTAIPPGYKFIAYSISSFVIRPCIPFWFFKPPSLSFTVFFLPTTNNSLQFHIHLWHSHNIYFIFALLSPFLFVLPNPLLFWNYHSYILIDLLWRVLAVRIESWVGLTW